MFDAIVLTIIIMGAGAGFMCAVDMLGTLITKLTHKGRKGDTLLDWALQAKE